jgi:glutamate synthase (NADPH/NADH) small chain
MYRSSSAHEEGVDQRFALSTVEFVGDDRGNVRALQAVEVQMNSMGGRLSFDPVPGTEVDIPCELVLLALGFVGPERDGMLAHLGVELTAVGTVKRDADWQTSEPGVFVCGDMGRGQSLIVWAIAEGRACAASVDRYLTGDSLLPEPVTPTAAPIR